MKFSRAIDLYIADMRAEGRINSPRSERSYRGALYHHCDDLDNRDPAYIGREDVKRTLRRWPHPNTQRKNRAVLVSFYDWATEEGYRRDNPARQTRRPKAKSPQVYRLTRSEAAAFLAAVETVRERRSPTSVSALALATVRCVGCRVATSGVQAGFGSAPTSPRVVGSAGFPSYLNSNRSDARSATPSRRMNS